MPRRQNLRPDVEDTLVALIREASSGNTTPHGVKTVTPGEGLQLVSADGSEIFWDWQAAQEYDDRITAGQTAIAEAEAALAQTRRDLDAAAERLDAGEAQLGAAVTQAAEAKQLVATTAAGLQALQGTVGDVSAAAQEADRKAANAEAAADGAVTAAGNAVTKAETASSAASDANAAALAAAGLAASKGEVIYQASPPTGSRAAAQNLWIRTSDNRPHTFDGSKWVQTTDKAAIDAAAAAAAAAQTAQEAKAAAEAASQKAVDALTAAGNAQSSADGKSTITTGAAAGKPGWNGGSSGDMHFVILGGTISEWWRWNGSGWLNAPIDSTAIANLDVGKLTGVFADIQKHLKAGSISTDYLTIGLGGNIIPNGGGQGNALWTRFGWNTSGPDTNNGYPGSFWLQGRKSIYSDKFPASPGEWAYSFSAKGSIDGSRFYVQLRCYDKDGAYTLGPYLEPNRTAPKGSWENYRGKVTIPAGTAYCDLYIYGNHPNGVVEEDAYQWFTGFSLRESVDGALVVNGSITGDHVDATSVAAEVARFLTIEAMTGVFTSSLTAKDATLLGTTIAEALVVKKLTGRDAILTGTVDIEQLNVTGKMAGTIASFMDVQARRAIFTEGLTANESTLLGTTVAEAINADTVASRIMTGGLLQTTTANNRGVKIDNSGIRAWDSSGKQTVQINGTNNYLTGTFATAEDKQRVEIKTGQSNAAADFYGSTSTTDHLGVWHQSDIGADTVSKIISFNQIAQHANSPGMLMYPLRGEFTFAGRWARESDTVKFVLAQNTNGIAAGAWADVTYTYTKPFTTLYSLRMPFFTAETSTGRECIVMVMEQTDKYIKFRVVNKSGGPSGLLIIRGVVFNMNTVIYDRYW